MKGSTTFFLIPFLPFESLLFFPTAILLRVGCDGDDEERFE